MDKTLRKNKLENGKHPRISTETSLITYILGPPTLELEFLGKDNHSNRQDSLLALGVMQFPFTHASGQQYKVIQYKQFTHSVIQKNNWATAVYQVLF